MLAHATALKTWCDLAPSLCSIPLDHLKAVQTEHVALTVQSDQDNAAADLDKALDLLSEQASACCEAAPRSTAGRVAALRSNEDQPLLPAALWLSAHLPAGCFPVFGRQRSPDMRCTTRRHHCMANVKLGFPLQVPSQEARLMVVQSWQACVQAECLAALFALSAEDYDAVMSQNVPMADVLEALIERQALPHKVLADARAVFGCTVAVGELASLFVGVT